LSLRRPAGHWLDNVPHHQNIHGGNDCRGENENSGDDDLERLPLLRDISVCPASSAPALVASIPTYRASKLRMKSKNPALAAALSVYASSTMPLALAM
jgi:hypothetical protein